MSNETKHTPEYILIYYKVRGAAIPNEMYPSQNDGYEYKDYREVIERTEDWERAYDNELIEDLQVLGFMPNSYSDLLKENQELKEQLQKYSLIVESAINKAKA